LVVTTGLRFYYKNPRKYDSATLRVGTSANPGILIPPKQESWTISGGCTNACSLHINGPSALPGGEIKFFASLLHAHTAGREIWTKLIRNGKEILELIRDKNYDFNYQQSHLLRQEVPFKAGDELLTYCRYNTMNRKDATVGGLSTADEMCVNFIFYYPRVDLFTCFTEEYKVLTGFSKKYGNVATHGNTTYLKDWDGVKWNYTMVEELKNIPSYQGNDAVKSICIGNKGKIKHIQLQKRPRIEVPLPPEKDICAIGVSNASLPMANVIMLSFLAFLVMCKLMKS